jgi:hypothetical protein
VLRRPNEQLSRHERGKPSSAGLVFIGYQEAFMKPLRLPIVWLLLAGAAVPLMGCEEGPLEEAGEEIDDAVDDVGDEIDRRN